MANPECYRVQRHYDEATRALQAAAQDLDSSSPNASPDAVRRARFETVKREHSEARDILIDHRRTCSLGKACECQLEG